MTALLFRLSLGATLIGGPSLISEASAQSPHPQGLIAPASQLELSRLIDLCSQRLGLRIDYDPTLVKGQVTLRLPDNLSHDELWALTNQLLAQRGFATVRAAGAQTLSVVRSSDAPQFARVEPSAAAAALSATGQPGFASIAINPKHRSVKELADAIRPLLTKGVGTATPLGDSRLLLVSDFTARLIEVQSLLDRLDFPAPAIVIEEIAVTNVSPAALATSMTQLLQKRDQIGGHRLPGELVVSASGAGVMLITPAAHAAEWRELITRFDQREGVVTENYTPRVFPARDVARLVEESVRGSSDSTAPADDRWRLVVDEMTGTLIVTATHSQHTQIASLLNRLDAANGGPLPLRSYPIRNRPASEMIAILSQLIEAGVLDSTATDDRRDAVRAGGEQRTLRDIGSATTSAAAAPNASGPKSADNASPLQATDRTLARAGGPSSLRLTADDATNTLIAIGEPQQLSQLEALLKMLDVRQPQVVLEAVLVSLTDTEALNLGVELEKIGNIGDAAYKIASLFGLSTSANGVRSVADSAGFTGAVINPGEFSLVVKALEATNVGRSLSNPKLLVANNEQARFSSVLQQPFVRTDTTSSTATSSFGGSESAGTTISVRPQIAQGDHLVLSYSINLSSFVGTPAAAGLPPPKQQNSVDSVATIPDGHVVVIGGLELQSESTSTSQIPLLGDVPLLGELFKDRSIGKTRTKFFIFIRAAILRNTSFEDLKYISAEDATSIGVPDGWPEVRPRVIR